MKRNAFTLEEIPGGEYPDLLAAQRAALSPLAYDLAVTIQALLTTGALVQDAGRIVPSGGKNSHV